jgi:hypothetical protein
MRYQRRRMTHRGPAPPDVPSYLVYLAIPPFLAAFLVGYLDPLAGIAMLVCLAVMVIVLNVLLRFGRSDSAGRDRSAG